MRPSNLHRRYMLIVNGSTSTGVADVSGNRFDGNGDGKPGDNYVAILRGFGLDKPGVPFNRLIRDQLHGLPLSSHAVLTKHARPTPVSRALPKGTVQVNRVNGVAHAQRDFPSPKSDHHRRVQPLKTR
jgi:hypothetical protein